MNKLITRILFGIFLLLNLSVHALDYVWVGGTGNWSDISHWQTSTGQSVSVIPGPSDNVFFNAASFTAPNQIVTMNATNASCNSMDWTGTLYSPTFDGANNTHISIYGSLTLIPNMVYSFFGTIKFEGTSSSNSIYLAGNKLKNNISFNGLNGTYAFMDSVKTLGTSPSIILNYGNLNTNNQYVECGRFVSTNTNIRSLNLGSSDFVIKSTYFAAFKADLNNFNFISNGSTIKFTKSGAGLWLSGAGGNINLDDVHFLATSMGNEVFGNPFSSVSIDRLVMNTDAVIKGSISYNTISLAPGHKYMFAGTHTIVDSVLADGTCSEPISISSNFTGVYTNFLSTNGIINLNYVSIRDIYVSGGASFVANNAIDLGGNFGWTMNTILPTDYYWVGGGGNWSDGNNWATNSGGVGSGCLPREIDNVFFDNNSFSSANQIVDIDLENAVCHDMDWTGANFAPELYGAIQNRLHIHGSLTLLSTMNFNVLGEVSFEATDTGNTITSATQLFQNDVIFIGEQGGWNLLDDFALFNPQNSLVFHLGTINTGGFNMEIGNFLSDLVFQRRFILNNSTIYITNGSVTAWDVNTENLIFEEGTSQLIFQSADGGMRSLGPDSISYYSVLFDSNLGVSNIDNSVSPGVDYFDVVYQCDGLLVGENRFENLFFKKGKSYSLFAGHTQTVNNFISDAACSGYTSIFSDQSGIVAYFKKTTGSLTENFLILQDISALGGAAFFANNSIDLGNNSGWQINSSIGLDLYWVGGSGTWSDSLHWAYTSGGVGGACIPGPNDNVFFDANSFSGANQNVNLDVGFASCHNMDWTGSSSFFPEFSGLSANKLSIYGSVDFNQNLVYSFGGEIWFRSNDTTEHINTFGKAILNTVKFIGDSSGYILQSNFVSTGSVELTKGMLNTNNYDVTIGCFISQGSIFRRLYLTNSHVVITLPGISSWKSTAVNFFLYPGTSLVSFTASSSSLWVPVGPASISFYNVEFLSTVGTSTIRNNGGSMLNFNKVIFNSNGRLYGESYFDSLLFTPGHTYTLEVNKTQFIGNYWLTRGNNCFPITLKSTVPGVQAYVSKSFGSVTGDFMSIQDQVAFGGASFYAGNYSTNISNNTGWIFQNQPGYVYGLGLDTSICSNDTLILSTINFNGSSGTTYVWDDNSISPTRAVSQPGTYWVTVTYVQGCDLTDSINIGSLPAIDSVLYHQQDMACHNDNNAWIKASVYGSSVPGFLWNNLNTTDSIGGLIAGTYWVTITDSVCSTFRDTFSIYNPPSLIITLDSNNAHCGGHKSVTAQVSGGISPYNFLWNTGSTIDSIYGLSGGVYQFNVTDNNGCLDSSIIVLHSDPQLLINPVATDIDCYGNNNGEVITNVTGGFAPYQYSWNTNPPQTGTSINNLGPGSYIVDVTDFHNCSASDTILISEPDSISFSITASDETCPGYCDGFIITTLNGGMLPYTYNWSNSSTDTAIYNLCPGDYSIEVRDNNNCLVEDSVTIVSLTSLQASFISDSVQGFLPLTVNFTSTGNGAATYFWDFGDGNNSTQMDPTHVYYTEGNMIVSLTVNTGNPHNCTDTYVDTILTIARPLKTFIPNTFTPNNDGRNDVFRIPQVDGKSIHVMIFNRFGEMIYQWDDLNGYWDGTINGDLAPQGAYIYSIHLTDYLDKVFTLQGSILLLR